ncbi:MAG TPA: hypothetical protein VN851_16590 [Thermoanaerobaculia bacterium]|nr:hypothetical protein [Thermoanaerobaculia bacterium]
MTRRSRDWNESLANDLKDPGFAREFLIGALDEGIPLRDALAKVIRGIGVKEFAQEIGMAGPNLLRAIHPTHNPTQETLDRLLRPFGLKVGLAPIEKAPGSRAA